mmetsp:Transcript_103066/g.230217  ORF Transcript_103066/g.230217 Transcript_103066/m.230217 type:complete len:290 (+) Transcript_103066:63-932(+)
MSAHSSNASVADNAEDEDVESEVDSQRSEQALWKKKIWVKFVGPGNEECKLRTARTAQVFQLRKLVAKKTRIHVREIDIVANGKVLEESRGLPLMPAVIPQDLQPGGLLDDAVMQLPQLPELHWRRAERLANMLKSEKLRDLNSRGKYGRTSLFYSVARGDLDITTEILDSKDMEANLINVQDFLGDSALMYASILGFTDLVELLIDRQASMDYQNLGKRTAVQLAAEHGHDKAVQVLLQSGASLKATPGTKRPTVPYLAHLNCREKVTKVIELHEMMTKGTDDLFGDI